MNTPATAGQDDTFTSAGVPRIAAARARAVGARIAQTYAATNVVTLPDGTRTHFSQATGNRCVPTAGYQQQQSAQPGQTITDFLNAYADTLGA